MNYMQGAISYVDTIGGIGNSRIPVVQDQGETRSRRALNAQQYTPSKVSWLLSGSILRTLAASIIYAFLGLDTMWLWEIRVWLYLV